MTDMARALVSVVQAVGSHASMSHVLDVFRGAPNPFIASTCRPAMRVDCARQDASAVP